MKRINNLTIKTTYQVGLVVDIPDDVYAGLTEIEEGYPFGISCSEACMNKNLNVSAAFDWLSDNIRERDAMDLEFEIKNLE